MHFVTYLCPICVWTVPLESTRFNLATPVDHPFSILFPSFPALPLPSLTFFPRHPLHDFHDLHDLHDLHPLKLAAQQQPVISQSYHQPSPNTIIPFHHITSSLRSWSFSSLSWPVCFLIPGGMMVSLWAGFIVERCH